MKKNVLFEKYLIPAVTKVLKEEIAEQDLQGGCGDDCLAKINHIMNNPQLSAEDKLQQIRDITSQVTEDSGGATSTASVGGAGGFGYDAPAFGDKETLNHDSLISRSFNEGRARSASSMKKAQSWGQQQPQEKKEEAKAELYAYARSKGVDVMKIGTGIPNDKGETTWPTIKGRSLKQLMAEIDARAYAKELDMKLERELGEIPRELKNGGLFGSILWYGHELFEPEDPGDTGYKEELDFAYDDILNKYKRKERGWNPPKDYNNDLSDKGLDKFFGRSEEEDE
jgi:hypothetical protein